MTAESESKYRVGGKALAAAERAGVGMCPCECGVADRDTDARLIVDW